MFGCKINQIFYFLQFVSKYAAISSFCESSIRARFCILFNNGSQALFVNSEGKCRLWQLEQLFIYNLLPCWSFSNEVFWLNASFWVGMYSADTQLISPAATNKMSIFVLEFIREY